ncbi:FtsX-like permease family protein [Granulicatella sp. zg-ZJ]|uniref:ABC transporter permease n=1 Tax=Granulicatella sp. zg-ZJ TaxID=2678504 RepID=UPI0013D3AA35|nr:ABC transporter permease [Granulicatella sp. zg-ZJ]NEW62538.1 FtsX-like permease family protein [Granulicatella sp. zg-ZJ]
MKRKIFWKDIRQSFSKSKGRFLSIISLMALGSFALVGLKVTAPDMQVTGQHYFKTHQTADISVLSDYGLDKGDKDLLDTLSQQAFIEYGYFSDVLLKDTTQTYRLLSKPKNISQYELVEGRLPEKEDEIAVFDMQKDKVALSDTLTFEAREQDKLNNHTFKVVGYIRSTDILSKVDLGVTTVGTGELSAYGIVTEKVFDSSVYMIARLFYHDLVGANPYQETYLQKVHAYKETVQTLLKQQPKKRLDSIVSKTQEIIDEKESGLKNAKQTLTDAHSQLEDAKERIDEGKEKLEQAKETLQQRKIQLDNAREELAIAQFQLDETYQMLQEKEVALQKAIAILPKEQWEQQAVQLETGKQSYEQGQAQLNEQIEQYTNGVSEYEQGLKTLQEKERDLSINEESLTNKRQEYFVQKQKADVDISDGEQKLADAKEKLSVLEEPVYHVYTRRETPWSAGYRSYESNANVIDAVGNIFPIVLYFVAALVTFTTMTRFVDEERLIIGTFKALGYTDKDIYKKFIIYGFTASMIGTLIGVLLGHIVLPNVIYDTYSHSVSIPKIELYIYPEYIFLSCLLAFISAVLPAYLVVKKELNAKPAQLLLPKPPVVSGAKILLEYVTPIWSRMSFTQKVTARNIFRYKKRMLMTIFGVSGSIALLYTGLGIRSSIEELSTKQFGDIVTYDMIVAQKNHMTSQEKIDLSHALSSSDVSSFLPTYSQTLIKVAGVKKDEQQITMIAVDNEQKTAFQEYIKLQNRQTQKSIDLTDRGIVLSERLAMLLNVKIGDTVVFLDENKNEWSMKISGITEMYMGHFAFITKRYYEEVFNKSFKINAYLVKSVVHTDENIQKKATDFMMLSGVKAVAQNTTYKNLIQTVVTSLNKVMSVLIISSVLLAIVILYNLTNINVAERIRELSTIKVLGFYDKEVTLYIYKETMYLSIIGVFVGFGLGHLLHQYIIGMVPPDNIMFNPNVAMYVYILPTILLILLLIGLGYIVHRYLKKVDMLEALKSVE